MGRVARPARIAILIDALITGGAERVAVDVACALDRTRFEPVVLVTRYSGPLERDLRTHGIAAVVLDRRHGFSPRKFARAVRLTRSCDLLHAHKLAGSAWGSLIARAADRPLVAHEHIWFGDESRVRRLLYRYLIGPTARRIVCVSDVVADSVVADGAPRERVETIPNGVDLAAPLPRARARELLGLGEDEVVVGIVARLRPQKRHEALLEAAALLKARGLPFTVCVVGDGPRREELESLSERLDVTDRVVFAGEHEDAARLAAAFDVAVMCSSAEGMPLSGLEAMAAGVPLVATAVSALPQLLAGGAGVLVEPEDDVALADAIEELMTHPDRARAIGEEGRRRVHSGYSFESMMRSLEETYDEVLAESGRRPPA
jgi:glycosyltransferase involved in cell wall biosynthesis